MKLTKIFYATMAVVSLAACSSNDDNGDFISKSGTIDVSVKLPQQTRGAIGETVPDGTPQVKENGLKAYILRGNTTVQTKVLELNEGAYKGTISGIALSGSERVVVGINHNRINAEGLSVDEIQPAENALGTKALENVYYYTEPKVLTKESDTQYSAEFKDILPVAARVEVSGKIISDEKVVKDGKADVKVIVPNNYSSVYDAGDKTAVKTTNKGSLWYDFSSPNLDVENNTKVIANHLFAGDEQRIAFQISADIYKLHQIGGMNVKVEDSYVYYATDDQTYLWKSDDKFYKVTFNQDGKAIVENTPTNGVVLKTTPMVTGNQGGFYALIKFGDSKKDAKPGEYSAGYVYKINLGKIDWNGDGKYDDTDKFNPLDPDGPGPGTVEPTTGDADVSVMATVKEWTLQNVIPGVE